jgi:hypothetical protein
VGGWLYVVGSRCETGFAGGGQKIEVAWLARAAVSAVLAECRVA